MIQKVSPLNPQAEPSARTGPHCWGSWGPPTPYGRKYYSLEVAQHPIRARMCGFGDKDRRPLAPAAVAKMVVQREDHSIVDVDEVDCSFFLVTVDLWSQDGDKEMNLVLHPTSSDRYVPSSVPKTKRRATTSSVAAPSQPSTAQTPVPPTPASTQYTQPQPPGMTPYMQPGYTQGYPFPPQQQPVPEQNSFQPVQYGNSGDNPTWGYSSMDRPSPQYGPPTMPTQGAQPHETDVSYNGSSTTPVDSTWPVENSTRSSGEEISYHTWPAERYPPMDNNATTIDPSLRHPPMSSPTSTTAAPWSASPVDHYNGARYSTYSTPQVPAQAPQSQPQPQSHPHPQLDTSIYASASYAQHQQEQQAQMQYQGKSHVQESTPPSTIPPLPRHTYTRTLVGPLSANACRLLDEHRKPGIFFLFQDLSIRTEGTFRLRLRLMNVGDSPAPETGGFKVHRGVSPVLAQTFTEPFIVYSAKRFPGVPDTTALSIALGNQGQKLPLRNRNNTNNNNSNKASRKRPHDDYEEESD